MTCTRKHYFTPPHMEWLNNTLNSITSTGILYANSTMVCKKTSLKLWHSITNTTNLPFNPLVSHFNPSKLMISSNHVLIHLDFQVMCPYKSCSFYSRCVVFEWFMVRGTGLNCMYLWTMCIHYILYCTRQKSSSCAIIFTENKTLDTQHLLHSQVSCKVCIVIS
jgi:hypothetical protein